MVQNLFEYDKALESFSKPLLECVTRYKLNQIGEMSVEEETIDYYRYIDFTQIAQYLYGVVERTVTEEFENELRFLISYDVTKKHLLEIVELPARLLDFFLRCVRENGGKLSQKKREKYFSMLTEEEIEQMEAVIKKYLS